MNVEAINRKEDINMKKKGLIIGLLVVVIITILVIVLKFGLKKEKPITDIKVNGNEIELDINRKFFLYDEDPLETEKEKIEPLKEVEVVIKGKGNCNNNKFEGEVNVEGFDLGGNFQSFYISREENGYEMIRFDKGYIYLTGGTPFAQRIAIDEDRAIKRIYMNILAEFLCEY